MTKTTKPMNTEEQNMKLSMETDTGLIAFIAESNAIEGIASEPTEEEIDATDKFLRLRKLTIIALKKLVSVYQSDAVLRDQIGLNVCVGNYVAPNGGPQIKLDLEYLLSDITSCPNDFSPYAFHHEYESLHPFTDGNGRSGRAIWAWHMIRVGRNPFELPFLHRFYYQSLECWR